MSRDVTHEKPTGPVTEVRWSGAPTYLDMARPFLARWLLAWTVWRMRMPPIMEFDPNSDWLDGPYEGSEIGLGTTGSARSLIVGWRKEFEKHILALSPAWICWRDRPEIHFDLNLQPSPGWLIHSRCYFPRREQP